MKKRFSPQIKTRRVKHPMTGAIGDDRNGAFLLNGPSGRQLFVIVSDGFGWDHVSVTVAGMGTVEPPNWQEMCWVKDQFFESHEAVVQYHPPRAQYVNVSECLHLWRPQTEPLPMPPLPLV